MEIIEKDANIIILCYDLTNKSSFEELKVYWYEKQVKINEDDFPILVILATKNYLNKEVKDEESKVYN